MEGDLARHLRTLEESLLLPDVRKSSRLAELIADDFVEFGSSGRVCTKADLAAALQAEPPVTHAAADFKAVLLAPQVALLTYTIERPGTPPLHTLRSSVWRLDAHGWRMVFHQATPVPR